MFGKKKQSFEGVTVYTAFHHNSARFTTPENPDIFRVVQYIMLCEAG